MLLHALDTAATTAPTSAADAGTVVLLHGLMGSAESWHRIIPLLVDRGHRVLALDLPGHGLSPRDPALTIPSAAASVVETVRALAPGAPVHAIGHSYGAVVLAAAARELRPRLGVYVDAAPALTGHQDRAELTDGYERDRLQRTSPEWLRESRSYYSEADAEVEARAAHRFDAATAASVSCGDDGRWPLAPGSIAVVADPSAWVTADDVAAFRRDGVDVRVVPGAAHTIWYSHFAEFAASLPELFGDDGGHPARLPL